MEAGWRLGSAARAELAAVLAGYASAARRLQAKVITLVGTEPIRRAADGALIVGDVERAAGVPLHVIEHAEEAILTLIGATAGRAVAVDLVVVDVGGGSTDIVVAGPGRRVHASGVRLGAATLGARHVEHDPPTIEEVRRMLDAARESLGAAPVARPTELVAVGGTASNVVRVLGGAADDRVLTRGRISEALEVMCAQPAAAVADRFAVRPARARLLPAGAAILTAVMERYGADQIRVSDAGIREGTILVTLHDPIGWRDRLSDLARGWVR